MSIITIPSGKIYDIKLDKFSNNSLKTIEISVNDISGATINGEANQNLRTSVDPLKANVDLETNYADIDTYRIVYGWQRNHWATTTKLSLPKYKVGDTNYYITSATPTFEPRYDVTVETYNVPYYFTTQLLPNTVERIDFSKADGKNPSSSYTTSQKGLASNTTVHINSSYLWGVECSIIFGESSIKVYMKTPENATPKFEMEKEIFVVSEDNISCYPQTITQKGTKDNIDFTLNWIPRFEICLGASIFSKPDDNANPSSTPKDIIKIIFQAKEANFIYGEQVKTIQIGDVLIEKKTNDGYGKTSISIGNDLTQVNNYYHRDDGEIDGADLIYNKTLEEYKNGKETATLVCAISDYYDNLDEKVIAKDGSTNRMTFELYDEVIPLVSGQPLSMRESKAIAFEVLGHSLIFDGSIKQKLHLQEKREVELDATISGIKYVFYEDGYLCLGATQDAIDNFEVEIPSTIGSIKVKYIGEGAFTPEDIEIGNTLTKVILPDTIVQIQGRAFLACKNLTTINLPISLQYIGEMAFMWCNLDNIIIPDNVTHIGEYSFHSCGQPKSITIGNGLKIISRRAFEGTSPQKIVLGQNVEIIDELAFRMSTTTKWIIMGDKVKKIGLEAFAGCTELESIYYYGDDYTLMEMEIDATAFENSGHATWYYYSEKDPYEYQTMDNSPTAWIQPYWHYHDSLPIAWIAPSAGLSIDNYQGNCIILGRGSFEGKNLYIAYRYDYYLTTDIQESAFINDLILTSVTIPRGMNYIGEFAFAYCLNLKEVTIPNSVTIGAYAFDNCPIENVYFKGTQEQWQNMNISLGNDALLNATIHFNS